MKQVKLAILFAFAIIALIVFKSGDSEPEPEPIPEIQPSLLGVYVPRSTISPFQAAEDEKPEPAELAFEVWDFERETVAPERVVATTNKVLIETQLVVPAAPTVPRTWDWSYVDPVIKNAIASASAEFGVDFNEMMRIAKCESTFNPNIVSHTDDHGLFQHNGSYGEPRFIAVGASWSDRYDPLQNARAAAWYRLQLGRWGGTPGWVCARLVGLH